MYLLDTNIVSELRKPKPHGAVLAWFDSVVAAHENLYISAVTVGEIQIGAERTREQDAAKAAQIDAWLSTVMGHYEILPKTATCFRRWAKLIHRQSDTRFADAMIAATAFTHNLVVVTRNVRDFEHFDCPLLNPFEYAMPTEKKP
jgi:toxin FitB